jgi:hypothetical protein
VSDGGDPQIPGNAGEARRRLRLRAELEQRGVAPSFSRLLAARLAPHTSQLGPDAYAAALDAAALAYGVQGQEHDELHRGRRELEEIQRLMQGFAGELRKLEEGLRILSAYALRMRSRAAGDGSATLH